MRFAFFTNTPAHVHLYRNVVRRLDAAGHDVLVLGRDYGCTVALLEYFDLPHTVYGSCEPTKRSLFGNLPSHFVGIARRVRRFRPDVVFGIGAYAAFAGAISRSPTVLVIDSEPTTIDHLVSRPVARTILTPEAFGKDLGPKQHRFRGFKECAYLHPEEFEPDPTVRDDLGLGREEPYAMVRFNAFGSHHDFGQEGFSSAERAALLERLAAEVPVLVSSEDDGPAVAHPGVRPFDLHPARIHDALAEASLLVADSQTMVTEAAMVGTPAIRSNSFVGDDDMGNFLELEARGLVWNLREFDDVLATADSVLAGSAADGRWRARRSAYVSELANLSDIIIDIALAHGRLVGESADSRAAAARSIQP